MSNEMAISVHASKYHDAYDEDIYLHFSDWRFNTKIGISIEEARELIEEIKIAIAEAGDNFAYQYGNTNYD